MDDPQIGGLVLAWVATGIIVTYVTGEIAFWPILIAALIVGVMVANSINR
jgi:hypothetical protein